MGIDAAIETLLNEPVPTWSRALPALAAPLALAEVGERGWEALGGDLPWPVMLLKDSALEHNIALMARYCAQHELELAPHAKTTMAPQLVHRQLQAGAWGITVATATQARLFHGFGVRRIIIANELLDPEGVRWVGTAMDADPTFEAYCLVDSVAGVHRLADLLGGGRARPLPVLLELGAVGRRGGCRSHEDARAVVDAIAQRGEVVVAGVETFEGVLGADRDPSTIERVDGFLGWIKVVTEDLMAQGAFAERDEVVVTAGGSVYLDRVAAAFGPHWQPDQPTRRVLRSGCYVTHDHGLYEAASPFGAHAQGDRLRPALEAWGVVLSRPEPDLAIVGFGRRDVPYDSGLPTPFAVYGIADAGPRTLEDARVVELNDQHAFVRARDDALGVGELLGCGISHPCTAFDKWNLLPVVDDDHVVTGAVRTFF